MGNLNQTEEKELLEKVMQGDHIAFASLFDNYHPILGSFIFSITKDKELAEEITLDVFLKIWLTREVLSEVNNFKAYLFTISRNAAINHLRRVIRERTRHTEWTRELAPENMDDAGQKEVYLSLIDEAIENLSPQRKKIFLMSRKNGLKYDDIALQLGISKFTVRAHIQQSVDSIVQFVKGRIKNELLLIILFFESILKFSH